MAKPTQRRTPVQPPRFPARGRVWSLLITLGIIGVVAVVVVGAQLAGAPDAPTPPAALTLDPQIRLNLTQLPQATPLTGEAAAELLALQRLVAACPDYAPERRSQMQQHLAWLQNPASIPPDMIIALGANPTGKLLYGMATYTSIQWRLNDRPAESCLVPIAEMLDTMLVAAGEPPFSAS